MDWLISRVLLIMLVHATSNTLRHLVLLHIQLNRKFREARLILFTCQKSTHLALDPITIRTTSRGEKGPFLEPFPLETKTRGESFANRKNRADTDSNQDRMGYVKRVLVFCIEMHCTPTCSCWMNTANSIQFFQVTQNKWTQFSHLN